MKAFGFILAALCLTDLPSADGRSFTSTDGRVLEGSLLRADDVNAVVGVEAGAREVTLPLARLSAADREFVAAWRLANPDLKFELSAVKVRLARRKDHQGGRNFVSEDWCYEITVESRSRDTLKGLVLHYSQFVLVDDKNSSKGGVSRHGSGTVAVPPIPPLGRVVVRTEPVRVESLNLRQDKGTVITTEKWNESLRGINVEAFWWNRHLERWNTGSSERLGVLLTDEQKVAGRKAALTERTLMGSAKDGPVTWRYVTVDPPSGWEKPGFGDDGWLEGKGPFQTGGASSPKEQPPTDWSSGQIWLRRRFTLPAGVRPAEVVIQTWVDDHAEVFFNGVKAARVQGPGYALKTTASREAVAALNPTGPNLIAVRARNTGGPSLIDVGLIEKISDPAAPEALK